MSADEAPHPATCSFDGEWGHEDIIRFTDTDGGESWSDYCPKCGRKL
jgi:hypothetical protein